MKITRGILLTGLLSVGVCVGGNADGGEPDASTWSWFSWFHCTQCPACPDDYCQKKLPPSPPCVTSHAPDDYCPKKLPCIAAVKCFGEDDYSRDPWRECLPVCAPAWYMCDSPGHCAEPPQP